MPKYDGVIYKRYNGTSWDIINFAPAPHTHNIPDVNELTPFIRETYSDDTYGSINLKSSFSVTNSSLYHYDRSFIETSIPDENDTADNKIYKTGQVAISLLPVTAAKNVSNGTYSRSNIVFSIASPNIETSRGAASITTGTRTSKIIFEQKTDVDAGGGWIGSNEKHTSFSIGLGYSNSTYDYPLLSKSWFAIYETYSVIHNPVFTNENFGMAQGKYPGGVLIFFDNTRSSSSSDSDLYTDTAGFEFYRLDKYTGKPYYTAAASQRRRIFFPQLYQGTPRTFATTYDIDTAINGIPAPDTYKLNILDLTRVFEEGTLPLEGGSIVLSNGCTLNILVVSSDSPISFEESEIPADNDFAFTFSIDDENGDPLSHIWAAIVQIDDHTQVAGTNGNYYIECPNLDSTINEGSSETDCVICIYYDPTGSVDYNEHPFYADGDNSTNSDDTVNYKKILITYDASEQLWTISEVN